MSQFRIKPDSVAQNVQVFMTASEELNKHATEIDDVKNQLDSSLASAAPALEAVSVNTRDSAASVSRFGDGLKRIIEWIKKIEEEIFGKEENPESIFEPIPADDPNKPQEEEEEQEADPAPVPVPAPVSEPEESEGQNTGETYAKVGTAKDPLPEAQMNANAEYIYRKLRELGWSKEAICALLGNMSEESGMNPGAWQYLDKLSTGYGLVQFSPADFAFLPWVHDNYPDIDFSAEGLNKLAEDDPQRLIDIQLEFLQQPGSWLTSSKYDDYFNKLNQCEYANYLPSNVRMSFKEFTQSTENPEGLALVFAAAYERSGDSPSMLDERAAAAAHWMEHFADFE